jgi:uracil-DNA glycosylase
MSDAALESLLKEVRACRLCEAQLPLGPRPVLRASATARLLVVGQAPGTLVHGSGIPWNDASGMRLREWLRMDRNAFYDEDNVAIVPMGFCYPGRGGAGDLPPRPECARTWHPRLLPMLGGVRMTLLIGQYAQAYFLGEARKKTLTDTVAAWREFAPRFFPLPHPSPRNVGWFRHNPWFNDEVLPALRANVAELMASP